MPEHRSLHGVPGQRYRADARRIRQERHQRPGSPVSGQSAATVLRPVQRLQAGDPGKVHPKTSRLQPPGGHRRTAQLDFVDQNPEHFNATNM